MPDFEKAGKSALAALFAALSAALAVVRGVVRTAPGSRHVRVLPAVVLALDGELNVSWTSPGCAKGFDATVGTDGALKLELKDATVDADDPPQLLSYAFDAVDEWVVEGAACDDVNAFLARAFTEVHDETAKRPLRIIDKQLAALSGEPRPNSVANKALDKLPDKDAANNDLAEMEKRLRADVLAMGRDGDMTCVPAEVDIETFFIFARAVAATQCGVHLIPGVGPSHLLEVHAYEGKRSLPGRCQLGYGVFVLPDCSAYDVRDRERLDFAVAGVLTCFCGSGVFVPRDLS